MSFYFTIIGTKDNPLFTYEFGTSKQGGDGIARFRDEARALNPFVVHSSLDILEEVQWGSGAMYLKTIDRFQNSHVSAFLTGTNHKFMLLSTPDVSPNLPSSSSNNPSSAGTASNRSRTISAITSFNPTSPATEEAIKNFFLEVYDSWVKACMNPFYKLDTEVVSPVFRARVAAAGRKFL